MFDIHEELKKLPDKPGIYIMKDEKKEIIYVGKAKVLKNRVRQYFKSQTGMTPKTRIMVSNIAEFEYIVTDSELEALILECNLIKKHRPKFNIALKDDKNYYPYIKITMNEEYPRVFMTRRLEKDGAKYFGPFAGAAAVKETLALIKKLFPIKSCNKKLPKDIGKERPCLNFYIYQCMGPCQGDVSKEEYRSMMKDICNFLDGRQDEIVKRLEMQMLKAADDMEFEKAAVLRDKLNSLRQLSEKQKVLSTSMEDKDVVAFAKDQTDSCVQVFFIRGGKLIGRDYFVLEGIGEVDDRELLESFVKQFYSAAAFIPGEILLQNEIEEVDIIEKWLSEIKNSRVYIRVPKKGEKLKLVEMAAQNAVISLNLFKDKLKREGSVSKEGLAELAETIGMDKLPKRIESFDISNTGSSEMVASMVVFENGKPENKDYRKFKIKSLEKQNDYGSMQEVAFRRFKRLIAGWEDGASADNSSDSFLKTPDLILVDGGLGHVNAVREVLTELGLSIPIYGMVKDDRHRTRGLVSSEGEIDLSKNLNLLRFVTAIQDETHRFAIEFNRKLRSKRYVGSQLDEIEGIGAKRKKALIKHFGSVSRIKTAEINELLEVEGINKAVAEKIYVFFR